MQFVNLTGDPPGEGKVSRITADEWLEMDPFSTPTALEKNCLRFSPVPPAIIKDALTDGPPIQSSGRMFLIPQPAAGASAQKAYVAYGGIMHVFRYFCSLPVFIDARYLAEKMSSREIFSINETDMTMTQLTEQADFLAVRNFAAGSPQSNDKLNLMISARIWRPLITVLLFNETARFKEEFPSLHSPFNAPVVRIINL
jgi:hypothetical protein